MRWGMTRKFVRLKESIHFGYSDASKLLENVIFVRFSYMQNKTNVYIFSKFQPLIVAHNFISIKVYTFKYIVKF